MSDTRERKRLLLFDSIDPAEGFVDDLGVLLFLPKESRHAVANVYRTRSVPIGTLSDDDSKALIASLALSRQQIESIDRVTNFFLSKIATANGSLQEISHDLGVLGNTDSEIQNVRDFLQSILQGRPNFTKEVRRALASNKTIDNVLEVGLSVDARCIFNDEGEVEDFVPVLIVRLTLDGNEQEREVVFQLSEPKLEQLCTALDQHKSRLLAVAAKLQVGG